MYSKNKIAQTILIVIVVGLAIILAILMLNKKMGSPSIDSKNKNNSVGDQKKEATNNIRNIKAKIKSVDISGINIFFDVQDREDLFLKIPEGGASLYKNIKQENGQYMVEEMSLFSLPINEEVEIQYDVQKKEVLMVTYSQEK